MRRLYLASLCPLREIECLGKVIGRHFSELAKSVVVQASVLK